MCIPDHLLPLVRELAEIHLGEQVHQVRLMGHDHPQSHKAMEHLRAARELVERLCDRSRCAA